MSGRRDEPVDVLLVENDDSDARLIRESFDKVAVETSLRLATDGDEALTILTDRGDEPPAIPDLVLLDLELPGMNGFELLETLTDEHSLARLPVLVLTRSATVADVHESYDLAANAYLTKPTDPDEYAEMVEAVADFWFRRAALPTNRS
ncbi:response regulator [Natrinema salaciae]|uniref:Response regulator receiver domain-containing protein n=1 Tax=Natrinema salaciae TaxID=1186196 RepID=A0A1H9FGV5_9EURY|nr:response regulator [Natrinema salaciae]SEQ37139.1 Response regulator receiver domain-containing protein [Natrinema salaciae]